MEAQRTFLQRKDSGNFFMLSFTSHVQGFQKEKISGKYLANTRYFPSLRKLNSIIILPQHAAPQKPHNCTFSTEINPHRSRNTEITSRNSLLPYETVTEPIFRKFMCSRRIYVKSYTELHENPDEFVSISPIPNFMKIQTNLCR